MDYSVKITSVRRTTHFLLFLFIENHIFSFCDLGIDLDIENHLEPPK